MDLWATIEGPASSIALRNLLRRVKLIFRKVPTCERCGCCCFSTVAAAEVEVALSPPTAATVLPPPHSATDMDWLAVDVEDGREMSPRSSFGESFRLKSEKVHECSACES